MSNILTADVVTNNYYMAPEGRFNSLDELAHLKGNDLVAEQCGRCVGQGRMDHFSHVYGGICFDCQDRRITIKKCSSVRGRIREAAKRAAKQQARIEAAAQRERNYEAAKAKRIAEQQANATPVPTGKVDIVGEVVSLKVQDGLYGTEYKMLVDGGTWRVWGTVPKALADADVARGDVVQFTATVEASKDDTSFGFTKRPSKAKIIAKAV